MKKIDESLTQFEKFKTEIEAYISIDLSESDTRSKLIDNLLINVLGWDENDIKREGHVESGFYDYKVSVPGIHFVIEAKRQFKEFSIPTKHKKVSLKAIFKENEEIVAQIRSYAIDSGIQYGIMTNGKQYIFVKLINTDSQPWLGNQCLLFNGLDDIENRFVEFFENLSKFGIISNGGFKYDYLSNTYESMTLLSTLIDREKELIRNRLSGKLIRIIESIFGEIFADNLEDDLDFIKKCFIENNETKKNRDEIERLFADEAPELAEVIPAVNLDSIEGQIKEEIYSDEIAIKNLTPPKPIIIVGSRGAGKSTFINHLFRCKIMPDNLKNHLVAYVDIRKLINQENELNPEQLSRYIVDNIYENYQELHLHSLVVYKRIYYKEIQRNDENIWMDDKENDKGSYSKRLSSFLEERERESYSHLIHLSKYLIRERRKRLIVIIDNADQYDISIQEQVFFFSHSLAMRALCGTVISLREGYYYKWRSSPPFDAYESNVYHISAPRYSEVLQSRLNYTLEKISLEGTTKGENEKGYIIEIENKAVVAFLAGVRNSLFANKNQQIVEYLSSTTYPNIREGLRVFKQFLTSGHTQVDEYIMREKFTKGPEDAPSIPIHEFIKSIGLQNKHYYNSDISIIHNLFIPPLDSNDHFLKFYILKELDDALIKKGVIGRYISNEMIVEKLNLLGYRINIANNAIAELIHFGLLETDEQLTDIDWKELPIKYNLTISSKGHYYLNELCCKFHYLDLVVQDTPIFNLAYFEGIRDCFPQSDENGKRLLDRKIQTINLFVEYLDSQESLQPNQLVLAYGKVMDSIKLRLNSELKMLNNLLKGTKNFST